MEMIKQKKKPKRKHLGVHPNIKSKCGGKRGCSYDLLLMPYCKN